MPKINKKIKQKLTALPDPIGDICKETVAFAQSMPEAAIKEHLDNLVRKAVKKEEENK